MLTRPKLIDPFQIVRMRTRNSRGTREFRLPPGVPFPEYHASRDDGLALGACHRIAPGGEDGARPLAVRDRPGDDDSGVSRGARRLLARGPLEGGRAARR